MLQINQTLLEVTQTSTFSLRKCPCKALQVLSYTFPVIWDPDKKITNKQKEAFAAKTYV